MAKQDNIYPLRLSPDVKKQVKAMAEENGRSLNKEIEIILKHAILKRTQESNNF